MGAYARGILRAEWGSVLQAAPILTAMAEQRDNHADHYPLSSYLTVGGLGAPLGAPPNGME
jgi:hypothetical protein